MKSGMTTQNAERSVCFGLHGMKGKCWFGVGLLCNWHLLCCAMLRQAVCCGVLTMVRLTSNW